MIIKALTLAVKEKNASNDPFNGIVDASPKTSCLYITE